MGPGLADAERKFKPSVPGHASHRNLLGREKRASLSFRRQSHPISGSYDTQGTGRQQAGL